MPSVSTNLCVMVKSNIAVDSKCNLLYVSQGFFLTARSKVSRANLTMERRFLEKFVNS